MIRGILGKSGNNVSTTSAANRSTTSLSSKSSQRSRRRRRDRDEGKDRDNRDRERERHRRSSHRKASSRGDDRDGDGDDDDDADDRTSVARSRSASSSASPRGHRRQYDDEPENERSVRRSERLSDESDGDRYPRPSRSAHNGSGDYYDYDYEDEGGEKDDRGNRSEDTGKRRRRRSRRDRDDQERSLSRDRGERKGHKKDKEDESRRDSDSPREERSSRIRSRGTDDFSPFVAEPGEYSATRAGSANSFHPPSSRPTQYGIGSSASMPGARWAQSSAPSQPNIPSRPVPTQSQSSPNVGLAAEYYGDQGQSVMSQPGYDRKESATPNWTGPSPVAAPQSSAPYVPPPTAAAPVSGQSVGNGPHTNYNGSGAGGSHSHQPPASHKPPKPGKLGTAVTAGGAGAAAYGISSAMMGNTGSHSHSHSHSTPGKPTTAHSQSQSSSYGPKPSNQGHHLHHNSTSNAAAMGALGAAAGAGAATTFAGAPHRPQSFSGDNALQPGTLAYHQRHHQGPFRRFVNFWKDPEAVGKYEEYTEFIGVCRYCFEPGTSARDAPRRHHFRSSQRSSSRDFSGRRLGVHKEDRYSLSSSSSSSSASSSAAGGKKPKKSRKKSWLAAGLAAYVGKKFLDRRHSDSGSSSSPRSGSRSVSSDDDKTSRGVTTVSGRKESREVHATERGRREKDIYTGPYKRSSDGALSAGAHDRQRRSRSRSAQRDSKHTGLGIAGLGAATAVGSAAVESSRQRRRSGNKSPITSPRSSRRSRSSSGSSLVEISRSNDKRGMSGFSSFFSAPSERQIRRQSSDVRRRKQMKQQKKKKGGIFSGFGSADSSSSEDADMAFGRAYVESSSQKTSKDKRDRGNIDSKLLGLGATAATLAATASHMDGKKRRSELGGHSIYNKKDLPVTSTDPGKDDGWESAPSGEQSASASSVDSALAYGTTVSSRHSKESISADPGTSKWGWRWRSKQKKASEQQLPYNRQFAGTGGGKRGPASSSRTSLQSMQNVVPVPTHDPGQYDVTRQGSFQALTTESPPTSSSTTYGLPRDAPSMIISRSEPSRIDQPQPTAPISKNLYEQAGELSTYDIPNVPAPTPTSSSVGKSSTTRRMSSDRPRTENRDETRFSRKREARKPRRAASSPSPYVDPDSSKVKTPRRSDSMREVHFDLTKEQDEKERRLEREREAKRPAASKERDEDDAEVGKQQRRKSRDDKSERSSRTDAEAGAVGALAGFMAGRKADNASSKKRAREERREERSNERDDSTDGDSAETRKVRKEQSSPRPTEPTPIQHESYARFFAPPEIQHDEPPRSEPSSAQSSPSLVMGPSARDRFNREVDVDMSPDQTTGRGGTSSENRGHFSWDVPRLNLIEPTPPPSVLGSAVARDIGFDDGKHREEPPPPETRTREGDGYGREHAIPPVATEEEQTSDEEEPPRSEDIRDQPRQAPTPARAFNIEVPYILTDTNEDEPPKRDVGVPQARSQSEPEEEAIEEVEREDMDTSLPRMPGDFGDDIEFAATLAAGASLAGFDPSIVTGDPAYRHRDSPPGSDEDEDAAGPGVVVMEHDGSQFAPRDQRGDRGYVEEGSVPDSPEEPVTETDSRHAFPGAGNAAPVRNYGRAEVMEATREHADEREEEVPPVTRSEKEGKRAAEKSAKLSKKERRKLNKASKKKKAKETSSFGPLEQQTQEEEQEPPHAHRSMDTTVMEHDGDPRHAETEDRSHFPSADSVSEEREFFDVDEARTDPQAEGENDSASVDTVIARDDESEGVEERGPAHDDDMPEVETPHISQGLPESEYVTDGDGRDVENESGNDDNNSIEESSDDRPIMPGGFEEPRPSKRKPRKSKKSRQRGEVEDDEDEGAAVSQEFSASEAQLWETPSSSKEKSNKARHRDDSEEQIDFGSEEPLSSKKMSRKSKKSRQWGQMEDYEDEADTVPQEMSPSEEPEWESPYSSKKKSKKARHRDVSEEQMDEDEDEEESIDEPRRAMPEAPELPSSTSSTRSKRKSKGKYRHSHHAEPEEEREELSPSSHRHRKHKHTDPERDREDASVSGHRHRGHHSERDEDRDDASVPGHRHRKHKHDSIDDAASVRSDDDSREKRKSKKEKRRSGGGMLGLFQSSKSEKDDERDHHHHHRRSRSEAGGSESEDSKHRKHRRRRHSRHRDPDDDGEDAPPAVETGQVGDELESRDDTGWDDVSSHRKKRKDRKKSRRDRYEQIVESGRHRDEQDSDGKKTTHQSDDEESFLGDRPELPSKDDGASGRVSSESPELATSMALQSRVRSRSVSPGTRGKAVDLPRQSHSRPSSPTAQQARTRGISVRGDPDTNPLAVPSPTAVPLRFGRSRPPHMSPSTPTATAADAALTSPTPHRTWHKRPLSTEFKTDREIRPLWLLERHGSSKVEPSPLNEPYPSLPSSKTTSRASSAEDLRTRNASTLADYQFDSPMGDYTPRRRSAGPALHISTQGLSGDVGDDENLLDSQQVTPTATIFGNSGLQHELEQHERSKGGKPKYEFHSPSELLMDPSEAMMKEDIATRVPEQEKGQAQSETQETPEQNAKGLESLTDESSDKSSADLMAAAEEAAQVPLPAEGQWTTAIEGSDEQTFTTRNTGNAEYLGPEEGEDAAKHAEFPESTEVSDFSKTAEIGQPEDSGGFMESRDVKAEEQHVSPFAVHQSAKSKKQKKKKAKKKGRSVDLGTTDQHERPADDVSEPQQLPAPTDVHLDTESGGLQAGPSTEDKQLGESISVEPLAEDHRELAQNLSETKRSGPPSFDVVPTPETTVQEPGQWEPAQDIAAQTNLSVAEASEADFAPITRKKGKKGKKAKHNEAILEATGAGELEDIVPSHGESATESAEKNDADIETQVLPSSERGEEKAHPVEGELDTPSGEPTDIPDGKEIAPLACAEPVVEEWEEIPGKKKKGGKKAKKARRSTINEQKAENDPTVSLGQTGGLPPAGDKVTTYDTQNAVASGTVEPEPIEPDKVPSGTDEMEVDVDSTPKDLSVDIPEAENVANDKALHGPAHGEAATQDDEIWTEPKPSKKQSRKEKKKQKKKAIAWEETTVPTEDLPAEEDGAPTEQTDEHALSGMAGMEENRAEEAVSTDLATGSNEMEPMKEEALPLDSSEDAKENIPEMQAATESMKGVSIPEADQGNMPKRVPTPLAESTQEDDVPMADSQSDAEEEKAYDQGKQPPHAEHAGAEEDKVKEGAGEATEGVTEEPQIATEVAPSDEFDLPKSAKARRKAKKNQEPTVSWDQGAPIPEPEGTFPPGDPGVEEVGESQAGSEAVLEEFAAPMSAKAKKKAKKNKRQQSIMASGDSEMTSAAPAEISASQTAEALTETVEDDQNGLQGTTEAVPTEEFELPKTAKEKKKAKKNRKQRVSSLSWEDEALSLQPAETVAFASTETRTEQTGNEQSEPQLGVTEEVEEPRSAKSKRKAKKAKKREQQLDWTSGVPSVLDEEVPEESLQHPPGAFPEEADVSMPRNEETFEPQPDIWEADRLADKTILEKAETDEDGKEFQVSNKKKKKNRKKSKAVASEADDWTDKFPPEQVTEKNEKPAVDSSETVDPEHHPEIEDANAFSRVPTDFGESSSVPRDAQQVWPDELDNEDRGSDQNKPEDEVFRLMAKEDELTSSELDVNVATEVPLPASPMVRQEEYFPAQRETSELGEEGDMPSIFPKETELEEAELMLGSQEKDVEQQLYDGSQTSIEDSEIGDRAEDHTSIDVDGHIQDEHDIAVAQSQPSDDGEPFGPTTAEDEEDAFSKRSKDTDESAPAVKTEKSPRETTDGDVPMLEAQGQTGEPAAATEDTFDERAAVRDIHGGDETEKRETQLATTDPQAVPEPVHEEPEPIQAILNEEGGLTPAPDVQHDAWGDPKAKKKTKKQKKASKANKDTQVPENAQLESDRDIKSEDMPFSKPESKKARKKKKKQGLQSLDVHDGNAGLQSLDGKEEVLSRVAVEEEAVGMETQEDEPRENEESMPLIGQDTQRSEEEDTYNRDLTSEHKGLNKDRPGDTEGQFPGQSSSHPEQEPDNIEEFDRDARPISPPRESVVPAGYEEAVTDESEKDTAAKQTDALPEPTTRGKQMEQDALTEPITQHREPAATAEREVAETAWPTSTKKAKKNRHSGKAKALAPAAPVDDIPSGEPARGIAPKEDPEGIQAPDKPDRPALEVEAYASDLKPAREIHPTKPAMSKESTSHEVMDYAAEPEAQGASTPQKRSAEDRFQETPSSLFGGPYGLAEKGYISPPKTPLGTINEHVPTESPPHTRHRDHADVGSPDRGVKHARQGSPPQRQVTADEHGSPRIKSRPSAAWDDYGTGRVKDTTTSAWPPRRRNSSHGSPEIGRSANVDSLPSKETPEPRRLRSAAELGRKNKDPNEAWHSGAIPPSSTVDPETDKDKHPPRTMAADVLEGWGDVPSSPRSPSRPPSVRRKRSLQHIQDLETRVDQLVTDNRELSSAKAIAERSLEDNAASQRQYERTVQARERVIQEKDLEIQHLKNSAESLNREIARLTELNEGLAAAGAGVVGSRALDDGQQAEAIQQYESTKQELEDLREQYTQLSAGMDNIVRHEIETAVAAKDAELERLRSELQAAQEKVEELQKQIVDSAQDDVFVFRDEDYFEGACQKLCHHVQQWVLRFSKFSDMRLCRLTSSIRDEKIADRFENAILDGSDVDSYLGDRVRRRDVFMSVVMTMMWEYIFTRYLFGMDREQRQKLKTLEKHLAEVGRQKAVQRWRATTLSLLAKRPAFQEQRALDTEAVVQEIYRTLSKLLPPQHDLEDTILSSLRKVMQAAVNLSIEMRTQRAEYVMLPPLQPEYDANGELVRKVSFNASLMNERSGETTSNEELEEQEAVVRIVLFPLVVKKGNDDGEGDEEIVVCPAQVLVARPGKDKKVVRVMSGDQMSIDQPNRSIQSIPSTTMGMGNVI